MYAHLSFLRLKSTITTTALFPGCWYERVQPNFVKFHSLSRLVESSKHSTSSIRYLCSFTIARKFFISKTLHFFVPWLINWLKERFVWFLIQQANFLHKRHKLPWVICSKPYYRKSTILGGEENSINFLMYNLKHFFFQIIALYRMIFNQSLLIVYAFPCELSCSLLF